MSLSKIQIILPVHNRLDITTQFIHTLQEQYFQDYHLILVDDGSTDGTAEFVKNNIKNLTIITGDGSWWWGGSLDKAYRFLRSKKLQANTIILSINDDCILKKDYLQTIVDDQDLHKERLIISPGHCHNGDFIERGFAIDWRTFTFKPLEEGEKPDAITTRGLYMYYSTYLTIGGFHPILLPHYLSDLEYTLRAKKKGFQLIISQYSALVVDRSSTGIHIDNSRTLRGLLYNILISKRSAINAFYWGNFCLLAAPIQYKIPSLFKAWRKYFFSPLALRAISTLGASLLNLGFNKQALFLYNLLLKQYPESPSFYFFRGNTHSKLNNLTKAMTDYNEALRLKPRLAIAYKKRGLLHQKLGHDKLAEADYKQAIALNPQLKKH